MSPLFRKLKTVLVIIAIFYILCSIYHTLLNIQLKAKRFSYLQSLSQEPLCNAHGNVVKRLRRLAKDLIHVRMTVDGDVAMAKQIERHYDNLQKLLREIEFITITSTHMKHRDNIEEDDVHNSFLDVCPEVFKGTTYGYPFYKKGFETIRCQQQVPTNKLVTFIFDGISCHRETKNKNSTWLISSDLLHLLESVNCSEVRVHIVLEPGQSITRETKQVIHSQMKNVNVHTPVTNKKAEILQDILNHVQTKYVLFGQNLIHFTVPNSIERMVRVLSSHNGTHFVGGSIKNQTGYWFNGCLQTQLRNYTLSFRTGYFHSFSSCLVCDHLTGPFLAKTASLKKLTFAFNKQRNLRHGLYQDLFLRAKQRFSGYQGYPIVSCPDVQFSVQPKEVKDTELVEFAKKHQIRKIIEADGRVRWFGCRRGLSYRTSNRCTVQSGYAVPPCCLENLADAVKFIMARCEENGILCELQEGTLLGAVKLNKVLPWERDADITFLSAHFNKLRNIKKQFQQQGYMVRESSKS